MSSPHAPYDDFPSRIPGLTCAEFLELTTDYLENALPQSDTMRFEAHLRRCDGCRTVMNQLKIIKILTGQLSEEDIDAGSLQQLMAAFRSWKNRPTNGSG